MERLKSRRNEVSVGVKLDDRDAKTQLDRFIRERALKVKVNLDQSALSGARFRDLTVNLLPELSDAARRLAEEQLVTLTRDRTVRIIADLDTRAAADDLAILTRARTTRVTADADTRAAADDLALLTRSRTVNVRVDVDRSALGILAGLGGSAGGVGMLTSRFAALAAAALSALPTIVSLGASLIQVGPAAAVAAPAVLSLGSAFAAVKLGTSGIGAAFKQAFAPATSSGNAAAAATRRVEDAQRSLAKAQQSVKDAEVRAAEARVAAARQIEDAQRSLKSTVSDVADANRRAAESVASAERNLADAQKAARQVQQDLTQARKDAAQELEDLNNRLADAQLDQRQKVLDLTDAEQQLTADKAAGSKVSAEQLAKDQLAYDRAVQALNEQQTETKRLQDQAAAANKAGVEGSATVAKAKQGIADANQEVADKTQALKDAEIEQSRTAVDGAQRVAKAERDVADARAAAAKAAVDGARSIADAQQSVADAARNVADAQAAGAVATSKVADAMAKLAPSAREFVKAVVAQGAAWRALKLDIQERLFKGLGDTFTTMARATLPSVHDGLVGTAGILNTTAKNAAGAVTELGKTGMLRKLFDGLNDGMRPLTKIPGQFITGLTQISVAASPAFKRLSDGAAGASDRISKKISDAFKSGALEKAINHAVDLAKQFGRLVGNVFGTLKNIMDAAQLGGTNALTTLGDAFAELRRVTGLPEMQKAMGSIFGSLHKIASVLIDVVGVALENLIPIAAPFVSMIAGIAEKVAGPLKSFFEFLGDHQTLVGSLASAVLAIVTGMRLWALATGALTLAQGLLNVVMDANPIGLIVLGLAGLAAAFAYAWSHSETFRSVVTGVWDGIKAIFAVTWDWINKLVIKPFKDLYDVLVGHSIIPDLVKAIIGWFTSLWTKTKELFTTLKNGVVKIWRELWSVVSGAWSTFYNGQRNAILGAWTWVRNSFTGLKTSIMNTWSSMWTGAVSKVTSIFSTLRSKIADFKTSMLNSVKAMRDGIGSLWSGIQSKFAGPVKWVISNVYNNGLRKMWNSIAGKINSKISLPTISLGFSQGGVVPGKRSNTDSVPAMLAPGERILSNGQVDQLGGHRAIDAMLGKDRPTKTGGNPSRQDERRRYQGPVQHFAEGGIIGKVTGAVGGAVSSAASWAKDLVVGGLKDAAVKALSALVRPLINRIPGGAGLGGLLKGLSNRAVDGMMSWFTSEDKKAKGGPAVQKALSWARTQNGKPYQWGGNNNPSWDCSGLVSGIESVIRGERPHRRWATGSFVGNSGPAGWVRNLNSPYMIGVTNAGVGHTAGTLAGVNVESRGGDGVVIGKGARGYNDSLFTSRWGFAPVAKYDQGGLLQPGATMAVNRTGQPEAVLTAEEHEAFRSLVTGLSTSSGGGSTVHVSVEVKSMTIPTAAEARRFAQAIADPVKEAIRQSDRSRM
ncbi:hypothetical protein [Streptomyces canus]|uniref:hypothetical protein n=1 Tax=Streptomyces canus TaxID=58343 RepID=UPI002258B313|nr:hypothetical protein [Streptomyces canus]MCX4858956.1 hypothetical protein [Streptomyces canus]